jgi:hypothetical protein
MSAKPTYKELVKRIQNLEHEALEHKQIEKTLQESEAALRSILKVVPRDWSGMRQGDQGRQ